ncbi:ADP-ribosylation factor-like protein 13B, partial [Leptidea sinapis]|uniref:ADP-ribosylation factor-like protein 13B n=1 Tax=Leptidea sinapis TaxID=189913 RepID=UPI0021C28F30
RRTNNTYKFWPEKNDYSRLEECKAVLEEVLSHDKISGKPVLVLANKQDKTGALDDVDVVEKLNIEPLVNKYRCPTLVESYTAYPLTKSKKLKIDPGLRKGYQWLLNYIVRRYGDINLRVQTDIHTELERRRRMLNRVANRGSQTFTAVSDDIATQTGFENPNFDLQKADENGLIVVKPIKPANDSTITIESLDDSDNTSKPKLSPLFGRVSDSTSESVKIELEPRSEYRKLSPIVRKPINHIDFKNRPQSSPTYRNKLSSSKSSSVQEEKSAKVADTRVTRTPELAFNRHRVLVDDVELSTMHREIVLTDRVHKASSDIVPAEAATLPLSARPSSASQLIRRQLEMSSHHRRRLSLRYMQRNKTSPERNSMLIYEPGKQKQLDKGDFEFTANTK